VDYEDLTPREDEAVLTLSNSLYLQLRAEAERRENKAQEREQNGGDDDDTEDEENEYGRFKGQWSRTGTSTPLVTEVDEASGGACESLIPSYSSVTKYTRSAFFIPLEDSQYSASAECPPTPPQVHAAGDEGLFTPTPPSADSNIKQTANTTAPSSCRELGACAPPVEYDIDKSNAATNASPSACYNVLDQKPSTLPPPSETNPRRKTMKLQRQQESYYDDESIAH